MGALANGGDLGDPRGDPWGAGAILNPAILNPAQAWRIGCEHLSTPFTSFFFNPVFVLTASYIPPAVILVDDDAFMAFIAFIAFIAGAILDDCWQSG